MGNKLWNRDDNGWLTPDGNAARYLNKGLQCDSDSAENRLKVLATGGDIDFFYNWNTSLIEDDARELRYMTTHFVVGRDGVINKSAGRNFAWRTDFAVLVGVGRALAEVKAQVDETPATRGRVKLAYTEWLFGAPEDSLFP